MFIGIRIFRSFASLINRVNNSEFIHRAKTVRHLFILSALFISTQIYAEPNTEKANHTKFQEILSKFLMEQTLINNKTLNLKPNELVSEFDRIANWEITSNKKQQKKLIKRKLELLIFTQFNVSQLIEQFDSIQQVNLVKQLLSLNARALASTAQIEVSRYSDSYLEAMLAIARAEDHYNRSEWNEVLEVLKVDLESLPEDKLQQSHFLRAVSLQKLKKHRESIKFYDKIPSGSSLYEIAQLNKAIALIRQDWWSDAHAVIQNILSTKNLTQQDELTNRLYLMIGYSLLRNEYLREARQAFRSVTLDSQYLTKSLFGISLVAIKQKDYQGALNSLRLIQEKNQDNLETYEVNVLLPIIYQNLGRSKAAINSYEGAIRFYQAKIQDFDLLNNLQSDLLSKRFGASLPTLLSSELVVLEGMKEFELTRELENEIDQLITDYKLSIYENKLANINKYKEALQSYLSQSRFGLAKLYDNSNE